MWCGRWVVVWGVSKGVGEGELCLDGRWLSDGADIYCMCVSMYGGCLVGKAWQWCLVGDVGTWCRWRSGFG